MNKSLLMRPLTSEDAAEISLLMKSQSSEYMHYFYAFDSDKNAISKILSECESDVYSGIFWQNKLIGIFMLRGLDAGYEIPSYGVLIDEKIRGKYIFELTIDAVKLICRLSGIKNLMVKMHSNRISPKAAKRLGLYKVGDEEASGNIIYHLDI